MRYSNYSGWLIKIGTDEGKAYTIPTSIIKADTYKASAKMQDIDDYTDANGFLHREAVELKALKVEFELLPLITDEELSEFLAHIDENLTIEKANQCVITAYVPRYNQYFTQTGYLADIDPQMYYADDEKIQYDPIRFAFIGGVYDGS